MTAVRTRLFLTCWLIFSLHFATDVSREHYLVLSIVEDHSFRLDKYVGLHNDIFMTPAHGAHHGANPGASMIAAIPYAAFKPVADRIANYATAQAPSRFAKATYNDERPARVAFFEQARARGLDIKFGLVGLITMVFCMAPLSAASAVFMFNALSYLGVSTIQCLGMSFLYAFGTPIFFRTGYLSQNLMVGIFAFIAFVLIWQCSQESPGRIRQRLITAGFLSGLALLCDYSGGIVLAALAGYALIRRMDSVPLLRAAKDVLWYAAGATGPIAMLWFYQWRSFGHWFYPPQHFMPPQLYSETGYQGVFWPSGELLWMLLFDPHFGLFISAPILALAFMAPLLNLFNRNILPLRETVFILLFSTLFTVFFSSVQYTRLQWITGIRYIVPVVPFLFLGVVAVLFRLPRILAYGLAMFAVMEAWIMAMMRRVDIPGEGIFTWVVRFFVEGFQLPWLTTVSKTGTQYAAFLEGGRISPLPIFVVCSVVICAVWTIKCPWQSLSGRTGRT